MTTLLMTLPSASGALSLADNGIPAVSSPEYWTLHIVKLAYLLAAILFILSLRGLSTHESSRRGNRYGIIGMTVALAATILSALSSGPARGVMVTALLIALAMIVGAAIGLWRANRVEMTGMPELIAVLHSFVGLAAVLVGFNSFIDPDPSTASLGGFHAGEVFLGVFIGAVTFTGSIVAFLKLSGRISGAPLMLPGRNWLNLGAIVASVGLMVWFIQAEHTPTAWTPFIAMTAIAFLLGIHLVAAIGGGDMPVVVSMLNSYSGWAAAAAGFMLGNDLLIIVGALVGSSGAFLSFIMCRAMNRSFISVILGGFGSGEGTSAVSSDDDGEYREISAEQVATMLEGSRKVVITPGYGMAVAQAQYPVAELTQALRDKGVDVTFGIHPVAGRLPGHMNVLLAEAKVPYDIVLEMDEVNDDFGDVDTVLVIGANDTVNPAAEEPGSPIAGMPVVKVREAQNVIVFKRSMATGYAGVQNPLFFKENTHMLFGDAKDSVDKILQAVKVSA